MTAAVDAERASRPVPATASPGAAFTRVINTAVEYAVAKASHTADAWTQQPAGSAADQGGATRQAGLRGAQAALQGKNPVWAAVKGAWSGSAAAVKAAIVAAMVALLLLLVLSPVLLLAFLLSLLVVAAVARVRRARS